MPRTSLENNPFVAQRCCNPDEGCYQVKPKTDEPGGIITDTQPPIDIGALIGKYAFGDVKK